jgi:hypothetical protein
MRHILAILTTCLLGCIAQPDASVEGSGDPLHRRDTSQGSTGPARNDAPPPKTVVEVAWTGDGNDRPTVLTKAQLDQAFRLIRETKFLPFDDGTPPIKMRRIPWHYPDQYCEARAAVAGQLIVDKLHFPPLKHIWTFGGYKIEGNSAWPFFGILTAVSPNAAGDGILRWPHHTALIATVEGAEVVLDLALFPDAPAPLKTWLDAQTARKGKSDPGMIAGTAICDANAFYVVDPCIGGGESKTKQQNFAGMIDAAVWEEHLRIRDLGRSIADVLDGASFVP